MSTQQIELADVSKREQLLWLLSAATLLIFFQGYMVAPLIPRLASVFGVTEQAIGLIVPAYMVAYGVSTLIYGLLSDRLGRGPILLASLLAFVVLTALTAASQTANQMIFWRLLTGLGASGVVPLSLALVGEVFPYERRGRPLGWLFGAMAGGMAFGSTVGVILEPFIGWKLLFLGVAALAAVVLGLLLPFRPFLGGKPAGSSLAVREVIAGYWGLLADVRGLRTYAYVFVNALFHSGVYTWLGLYFIRRFGLGEIGIGLALLGYGIPGFVLGPILGRAADRWGRRWLVPTGLALAAVAAALLMLDVALWAAAVAVALLSLGYDMTQPLLAGIVTTLGGKRRGQAMGLNVFLLFTGFGLGSLLFGELLRSGFTVAFSVFLAFQLLAALAAVPLFRSEMTPSSASGGG